MKYLTNIIRSMFYSTIKRPFFFASEFLLMVFIALSDANLHLDYFIFNVNNSMSLEREVFLLPKDCRL